MLQNWMPNEHGFLRDAVIRHEKRDTHTAILPACIFSTVCGAVHFREEVNSLDISNLVNAISKITFLIGVIFPITYRTVGSMTEGKIIAPSAPSSQRARALNRARGIQSCSIFSSYTGDARVFFRFSIFFVCSPRFASAADAAEAVSPLFAQQILRKSRPSQPLCSLHISSFCAFCHFLANHIRPIRGLVYFVASAVGRLGVFWLWKPFGFLFCFPGHCRFGPLCTIWKAAASITACLKSRW